jgi:predicted phosphoribosyltransferase
VAQALHAPLDVFMVRKVGAPTQPELAIAAVASGDIVARNEDAIRYLDIDEERLAEAIRSEQRRLQEQEKRLREGPPIDVEGRDAIIVDDGLATGATMRVAIRALRQKNPSSVVAAAPVGAPSSCSRVQQIADKLVCPLQPPGFAAVGSWYREFGQTSDEEVRELLEQAGRQTEKATH